MDYGTNAMDYYYWHLRNRTLDFSYCKVYNKMYPVKKLPSEAYSELSQAS